MSDNTPETALSATEPCCGRIRTHGRRIAAALAVALMFPSCLGSSSISSDDDFMAFYDDKVDALKEVDKGVWREFKRNRGDALKALLGADGGDVDDAFFAAAVFGSEQALDYLVEEKGFKPSPYCLKRLARLGDVKMCTLLMEKYGAKPEADTLAAAARGGSLELCKYLCEKQGADAAKLANLLEILRGDAEELKRAAAEISILTDDELSAEKLAERQLEVVKFFIEKGAPISSPKAMKQLDRFNNKAVVEFLRADVAAKTPPPAPEPEPVAEPEEEKPYDFGAFFAQMEAASDRDAYIAVMKQMADLPDYRRFRVGEVVLPTEIPFEQLSSSESSKSTWWVTPSEVEILPTEESVRFYNEEIYPRYKAFFSKFALAVRTKTATVPVRTASGDDGTWTRRKHGELAMVAKTIDATFGGRGSFKIVLEKLEETDFSKLKAGSTVNCEITVIDLPEAYQSFASEPRTRYTDAEVRIWLKDAATDQRLEQYITMDMDVDKTMHTNNRALVVRGFSAGIVRRTGDAFVKVRRKMGRVWVDPKAQKPASVSYEVALRDPYEQAADDVRERRKREAEQARLQREREEERRRREEEERSPGYFD